MTETREPVEESYTMDKRIVYPGMTENQHTALYQARHLVATLSRLSASSDEFLDFRREHLAVTLGLIEDLIDTAVPNLVWRAHDHLKNCAATSESAMK
jgi:hypothetical protein